MPDKIATLQEFVQTIFSLPPDAPHAHRLGEEIRDPAELAGLLMTVFVHGAVRLFGDDQHQVDLQRMTLDDIAVMERYFASFGYSLGFEVVPDAPYEQTRLIRQGVELSDIVIHRHDRGILYRISFDHLSAADGSE